MKRIFWILVVSGHILIRGQNAEMFQAIHCEPQNPESVETLSSSFLSPGEHRLTWNSNANPSGIYIACCSDRTGKWIQKLCLIK